MDERSEHPSGSPRRKTTTKDGFSDGLTDYERMLLQQAQLEPSLGCHACAAAPATEHSSLSFDSLFFLAPSNPFRLVCFNVVQHRIFEGFIIFTIFVNCVILALNDPKSTEPEPSEFWFEVSFAIIFTIEMLLKVVAYGFVLHPGAYLRDGWNRLDFSIVILQYLTLIPSFGNFTVLRAFRVLKPLRSMNAVAGLKNLVTALFHSVVGLINVAMLLGFFFLIFGLLGMQLFKGRFSAQCQHEPSGRLLHNDRIRCDPEATQPLDYFGLPCPAETGFRHCNATHGLNPLFGFQNFDNAAWSFLTVFQIITFEGWVDVLMTAYQVWGTASFLYFFLLLLLGAFFAPNLAFAVIYDKFEEAHIMHRKEIISKAQHRIEVARRRRMNQQILMLQQSSQLKEGQLVPLLSGAFGPSVTDIEVAMGEAKNHVDASHQRQPLISEPEKVNINDAVVVPLENSKMASTATGSSFDTSSPSHAASPKQSRGPVQPSEIPFEHSDEDCDEDYFVSTARNQAKKALQRSLHQDEGGAASGDMMIASGVLTTCISIPQVTPSTAATGTTRNKKVVTVESPKHANHTTTPKNNPSNNSHSNPLAVPTAAAAAHSNKIEFDSVVPGLEETTEGNSNKKENDQNHQQQDDDHVPAPEVTSMNDFQFGVQEDDDIHFVDPRKTRWWEFRNVLHEMVQGYELPLADDDDIENVRQHQFDMFQKRVKQEQHVTVFAVLILVMILLNTVVLAVQHHEQPQWLTDASYIANIVFTAIFSIELIIVVTAIGPTAFVLDQFYRLDFIIVVLSIVELIVTSSSIVSVFRALRLLRVLKILRQSRSLRSLVAVILAVIVDTFYLNIILLLFLFIASLLGMTFFGGVMRDSVEAMYATEERTVEFDLDSLPWWGANGTVISNVTTVGSLTAYNGRRVVVRSHFDTIYNAFYTCFQLITTDNWNNVMTHAMVATHVASSLFFVILVLFGSYVMLNLFLSIILQGFTDKGDVDFDPETEAGGGLSLEDIPEDERPRARADELRRAVVQGLINAGLLVLPENFNLQEAITRMAESGRLSLPGTRKRSASFGGSIGSSNNNNLSNRNSIVAPSAGSFRLQQSIQMSLALERTSVNPPPALLSASRAYEPSPGSFRRLHWGPGGGSTKPHGSTSPGPDTSKPASFRRVLSQRDIALGELDMRSGTYDHQALASEASRQFEQKQREQTAIAIAQLLDASADLNDEDALVAAFEKAAEVNDNNVVTLTPAAPSADVLMGTLQMKGLKSVAFQAEAGEVCPECGCEKMQPFPIPPGYAVDELGVDEVHNDICEIAKVRHAREIILQNLKSFVDKGIASQTRLRSSDSSYFVTKLHSVGLMRRLKVEDVASWEQMRNDVDECFQVVALRVGEEQLGKSLIGYTTAGFPKVHRTNGGDALYCFGPENPLRVRISAMVRHPWFDNFILFCIVVSSIILALDNPREDRNSTFIVTLNIINYVFTLLFLIEMLLKWITYGVYQHRGAYFRDSWNILDFTIVVISLISVLSMMLSFNFGVESLRALRALRALRPLRVIQRNRNLKLLTRTLLQSIKGIRDVALLTLLAQLVFGILSTQFFGGMLYSCTEPSITSRVECLQPLNVTYNPQLFDPQGFPTIAISDYFQEEFADHLPVDSLLPPWNQTRYVLPLLMMLSGSSLFDGKLRNIPSSLLRHNTTAVYSDMELSEAIRIWQLFVPQPRLPLSENAFLDPVTGSLINFYVKAPSSVGELTQLPYFTAGVTTNANPAAHLLLKNFTIQPQWKRLSRNFDNILYSMISMFQVSSGDDWTDVMYSAIDAKSVDEAPERDYQPAWGLYFIVYYVISNFFMLNLFVGVILFNFEDVQWRLEGGHLMTAEQQMWVATQAVLMQFRPAPKLLPWKGGGRISQFLHDRITSPYFDIVIALAILGNVIVMALDFETQPADYAAILFGLDSFFVFFFLLEALLKLMAHGLRYFTISWNQFDFLLVVVSLLGFFLDVFNQTFLPINFGILRVFRILKIFLVMRLFKTARQVRVLIETLWFSLPSLANISFLMVILYFAFAIIGMQLFALIKVPGQYLDDQFNNFQTFLSSMQMMFVVTTNERWSDTMYDCMIQPPYCEETIATTHYSLLENGTLTTITTISDQSNCGTLAAPVYFVVLLVVTSFVVANLFIAIILASFKSAMAMNRRSVTMSDLMRYTDIWPMYDPDATGLIPTLQLSSLLEKLQPPLGLTRRLSRTQMLQRVIDYHIPDHCGDIHFIEVLVPLARTLHQLRMTERDIRRLDENVKQAFPVLRELPVFRLGVEHGQPVATVAHVYAVTYLAAAFRRKQAKKNVDRIRSDRMKEFQKRDLHDVSKLDSNQEQQHHPNNLNSPTLTEKMTVESVSFVRSPKSSPSAESES